MQTIGVLIEMKKHINKLLGWLQTISVQNTKHYLRKRTCRMKSTCSPTICVIMVLVTITAVHSLPTRRREAPPTNDQIIAINKLLPPLVMIDEDSDSLYSLWQTAFGLTGDDILNAEVSKSYNTHAYNIHVTRFFSVVSAHKA